MIDDDYEITAEDYALWEWYKKQQQKVLIEMFIASLILFVVIYSGQI